MTVQVAVKLPSIVVTVIIEVPAPTVVTVPLLSTVAAAGLLEVQVRPLLVALVGATVAVNCSALPAVKIKLVLFRLTPVTEIASLVHFA